ncbi:SDR family NAD(P)-dependent oxidoreductase [Mycobacterium interjectum]|uniref:SDR family NAD(P)-dependent oxidoreductase n=1 Tax=Mycobacterium interjectum TaxID=33895 RepID=UPI000829D3D3|nr:SDR family NAD(P)-dependent oxidoreductase [Mycobacterium interjectum]MCV7090120.1 SDR family NAD(P)-dependent oxidoreductase [Mycobacterium interjectum]
MTPHPAQGPRRLRTWFIPEADTGFALALSTAAAGRGDNVVALARDIEPLQHLVDAHDRRVRIIAADIRDQSQVQDAVTEAVSSFGRIDVVANTTFHDVLGAVEEIDAQQAATVIELNVLGLLNVLRAVLPILRAQRSGHVLQASPSYDDIGRPGAGLLSASVFAVDGLTDSLAGELRPLGIQVTTVDTPPTAARVSSDLTAGRIAAYDPVLREGREASLEWHVSALSNTDIGVAAILTVADTEDSPLRLVHQQPDATPRDGEKARTLVPCPALLAAQRCDN